MYMTKCSENFVVNSLEPLSSGNSFFLVRPKHDQSEIEVAQLMACMGSPGEATPHNCSIDHAQNANMHFYPTSGNRNYVYHPVASMSFEMADTATTTRGRRTSPKKLILSPSRSPCPNCGVESSTLWRNCDLQTGSHYLCNACGLRYKKGKYCPLCYQVYYDADTNLLYWAQCQSCSNWTHKSCLLAIAPLLPSPYICCRCAPHNSSASVSTAPGTGGLC